MRSPQAHVLELFSLLHEHTKYISQQILCPLNKHDPPRSNNSNLKKKIEKMNFEQAAGNHQTGIWTPPDENQLNLVEVASDRWKYS